MEYLYYNKLFGRLGFGLSAEVWVVQVGIFLNYLGWGAVMPFEVLYLHDGRGFSLGFAGLVIGVVTGLAVVAAPVAGTVIDRVGARATAAGAGVALAAGYSGLAVAHTPRQALIAALAAGIGNGALLPSQSALLASLAPPELRHRASAVSRVASNVGVGIGAAIGGLVAAYGLNGFMALFLANAVTYVLYAAILVLVVREDVRPTPVAGGYRVVLRDRPFLRLAVTNVAMIAVGWGVLTWVVPPYAREEIGVGTRLLGLLLFANAFAVVLAQIPVAKLAEGRRRAVTMAIAALMFAVAWLLVAGAEHVGLHYAYAALLAAAIVVGVGECLHTTVLMPTCCRSGAGGVARPLHGGDGTFVVPRAGARADPGDAAAERVARGGDADLGRGRHGGRRVGALAGATPAGRDTPDSAAGNGRA